MSLIELKNVSKIYRLGSQKIHALTDLSLTFDEGEFAVLAG
ncbi:MAG: ABC transporter ATP-binding protein, partial [Gammaproteobacteria bacterium]